MEIHVQFLGEQSRAWVSTGLVKRWEEKVDRSEGEREEAWRKGLADAEKVTSLSPEERLDVLLVTLLPSDDEWSEGEEETSPGAKENKEAGSPSKKRRRIMVLDSDDSDGDPAFEPSKEDLKLAKKEAEEDQESGASERDPSSEDEPESSPTKGTKRKMSKKVPASKAKKTKESPEAATSLTSNLGKYVSGLPSTPTTARLTSTAADSTKKKLSMFGAPSSGPLEEEGIVYMHNKLTWLRPENIKDKDGRKRDHPEYDCRTLYVPPDFLKQQSPGQKQWWTLKAQYFDVVLFFKMGKFYELYNKDADIGVKELNLVYMRGEQAHAGFPEVMYSFIA